MTEQLEISLHNYLNYHLNRNVPYVVLSLPHHLIASKYFCFEAHYHLSSVPCLNDNYNSSFLVLVQQNHISKSLPSFDATVSYLV